jgi:hypothetical protein
VNREKNTTDFYSPVEIKPAVFVREPIMDSRLLNPIERISEILFGLIMALSFTCAISVAEVNRIDVKQMLLGAIGCNIAWGIIDAIMYLMNGLAQRGRDVAILNFVRKTEEPEKAVKFIAETISPEIAEIIGTEGLEQIRKKIVSAAPETMRPRIFRKDLKMAFGIFLLVFGSTFPVAIPFALIKQVHLALRVSNLIAIILLFMGGWLLAKYGGYNKFRTGLYMALTGIGLVFLTITLGG